VTLNPWIPEHIKKGMTPKQVEFLCYEGREGLFGGSAGPGKSVALLAAALQWIEDPGANSLIIRRTYAQLSKADSILNKSKEWLMGRKDAKGREVKWNSDQKKWTFPNGNTLEFAHMENEDAKFNLQGGIWSFVGVDEATQFTEPMLAYPRSRQRRIAGSQTPIRWRGATNPGGVGHDAIKNRYIKTQAGTDPQTPDRQFFPAKLADNPNIDREEYVTALRESGVDPLTLAQLLEGDWDAVPGGRFRRDWFRSFTRRGDYITLLKPDGSKPEFVLKNAMRFITVDPAASTSTKADWTVIGCWAVSPWGDLVWLDCARVRLEIPDIVPEIQRMWTKWRPMFAGIEAIASNVAVYQMACRATNPVLIAKPLNKGPVDKLIHASPAIVLASTGRLYFPAEGVEPRFPIADIQGELVRFTGNDKEDAHDDVVDVLSYATECMNGMPNAADRKAMPRVLGGI